MSRLLVETPEGLCHLTRRSDDARDCILVRDFAGSGYLLRFIEDETEVFSVGFDGAVLINGSTPRVWHNPPVLSTDAGTIGDEAYDPNYYYLCTKTGVMGAAAWKRVALSSF